MKISIPFYKYPYTPLFWAIYGRQRIHLCKQGIDNLFELPKNAHEFYLCISDKRTKESYLCRYIGETLIMLESSNGYYEHSTIGGYSCAALKSIKKRCFGGKSLYISIEYIED